MACKRQWGRGKRGGGKQFEAIGNRKIIALKSGTYVKFLHHLEENRFNYAKIPVPIPSTNTLIAASPRIGHLYSQIPQPIHRSAMTFGR
jgi:hypothetical protein